MLHVAVPATTSNLGPGFDVLGLALGLRNVFSFEPATGWSAHGAPCTPDRHLALHTAVRAAARFGGTLPPLAVTAREAVPRSRGLGSSATARVAGWHAAVHFAGLQVPLDDALQFLADEEGHPDNAVPAMVGGLTLCASEGGRLRHLRFDPPPLRVALCVPGHEVATAEARALLPDAVPRADAVANVASVAFLVAGLVAGRSDAVAVGLADRLHQPYRARLIGPIDAVFAAARAAGALGGFVSGSGSALAALVPAGRDADAVAAAMVAAFGAPAEARVVDAVAEGATTSS